MKILLVNSAVDEENPSQLQEPLAVAYLAAVLIENGHEVRIKDYGAERYDKDKFIDFVGYFSPDLFGVSCFTSSFPFAKKIIDHIKEFNSDILAIIGGIHVSIESPKTIFGTTKADIIIRGEGERTIIELVDALEKGKGLESVNGISFKNGGGRIVINKPRELIEDLNSLPFPARELLPMELYKSSEEVFVKTREEYTKEQKLGNILSSRGCPFNCIYCCSVMNRRKIRLRSAKNVFEEMEILYHKYSRSGIYFVDDQFTFDRKRLEELMFLIKESGLDFRWRCQSRVDKVDYKLLKKMKESGCTTITYGTETGDDETLKMINKKTTLDRGYKSAKITKRVGIHSRCNFMIGFPWDTHKSIRRTLKFAAKIDPNSAAFYLTTPYPGTDLWNHALDQKIVSQNMDWKSFTNKEPHFRTKNVLSEDLDRYLKFGELYVFSRNMHKELFNLGLWYNFFKDYKRTKNMKDSLRINFRRMTKMVGLIKEHKKGESNLAYFRNQMVLYLRLILS